MTIIFNSKCTRSRLCRPRSVWTRRWSTRRSHSWIGEGPWRGLPGKWKRREGV